MEILKPLKQGNVLTEEEALRDLGYYDDEEMPTTEFQVPGFRTRLGKDYGLALINRGSCDLCTTVDGNTVFTYPSQRGYHKLFFDENLYFTRNKTLYKWPSEKVSSFAANAFGVCKLEGMFAVALEDGIIVHNNAFPNIRTTYRLHDLVNFKSCFYSTTEDGKLLVTYPSDTPSTYELSIPQALCLKATDDILYIGGADGKVTAMTEDGSEEVCQLSSAVHSMEIVQEDGDIRLLYVGGEFRKGITIVNLANKLKKKILEETVEGVSSIVKIPLTMLEDDRNT